MQWYKRALGDFIKCQDHFFININNNILAKVSIAIIVWCIIYIYIYYYSYNASCATLNEVISLGRHAA